MSMRIVPSSSHPATTAQSSQKGAPSAPGVHDTLRSNLSLTTPVPASTSSSQVTSQLQSTHPLETRLTQWRSTQDALKMNMLAQQFGMAEPVRRGMEMHIAREGEWTPALVSRGGGLGSSIAGDILSGRDCELGWEDVFNGNELRAVPDFHTEMEAKMRMNW